MRSEILLVSGRFQIDNTASIGSGAFSRVHPAIDLETQQEVAVKIMLTRHGAKQVQTESKILKLLQGQSFPRMIWHGTHQGLEAEVMQRLGRSLLDLFLECGRKFSLSTVLQLADQLIPALQELHSLGYVHMDLKPDNLVMGRGAEEDRVFLIDFGLAQLVVSHGKHVKKKKDLKFKGNAYWASTNLLRGMTGSRRDDMEALMYVLLYLLKGDLPWQQIRDRRNRIQRILEVKSSLPLSTLCHSLPPSFLRVFEYIRSLTFSEEPNYSWMRQLFRETAETEGIKFDRKFEWKEAPREFGVEPRNEEDWGVMDSPEDEHYSQDDTSEVPRPFIIHKRARSGSIYVLQQSPTLPLPSSRSKANPMQLMAALNRQDTGSRSPGSLLFVRQSSLKTSSSASPCETSPHIDLRNADSFQEKTFSFVSTLAVEDQKNDESILRRKSIKISVLPAKDDTPISPDRDEKEETPKTEKAPQFTQFVREKLADNKK